MVRINLLTVHELRPGPVVTAASSIQWGPVLTTFFGAMAAMAGFFWWVNQ